MTAKAVFHLFFRIWMRAGGSLGVGAFGQALADIENVKFAALDRIFYLRSLRVKKLRQSGLQTVYIRPEILLASQDVALIGSGEEVSAAFNELLK